MKKISLILVMLLVLASVTLVVGCQKKTTEVSKDLPTFEKLLEINSYSEIFKTHKNIYVHNESTDVDPSKSIIEDAVLMYGNDKVEYHMIATNAETKEVIQEASRIGNAWYYYDIDEGTNAILEVGVSFVAEFSLPDFFDDCKPIGSAYVDGGYIVYHAYSIFNKYDDIDAVRYDYTYYFNQETYLLEKISMVRYNNNHEVVENNLTVITYDVNVSDIFETTIYDKMHSSENRIDVEIVVDYNTENEKRYNIVATTDSILYAATINDVTYLTYSDPECQNRVDDLSVYEGLKSVTLYADELTFDDEVRTTVTEEEWNYWTTFPNYTIQQYYDGELILHKYTEDALELQGGDIIMFIGDKQYYLEETVDGFVARDVTTMEFAHGGLLRGGYVYDEFTYDEELGAYVLDCIEEYGMYWEIRFEDGVPVSIVYIEYVDGVESLVVTSNYFNVGTTVINIPDYVFEEEDTTRYTVTEDEWNANLTAGSYAGEIYIFSSEGNLPPIQYKSTDNAIVMDGLFIVSENGKKYQLLQSAGIWYAIELEEDGIPTMVPQGIDMNDYEYYERFNQYVPKEKTGSELYYSFGFRDGVLSTVTIQTTLDDTDPEYYEFTVLNVTEIGTVEIDIPDYIIQEGEARTTVTEEEWNFWTTYKNYTIEQYYNGDRILHKYTEDALLLENGNIILFIGDKQYSLSETENGFVAHDCTGLEILNNGLLYGGYVYDEFTYDEELGAYVLDLLADYGMYWEVKFENGIPVSIIYNEFDGDEVVCTIISYYHNVGTTVVNIPDYVFEEEVEDTTRYTVTEEEWNSNVNSGNYAGVIHVMDNGEFLEYTYKCAGNAIEVDGDIVVFENGKIYLLNEVDGVYQAVEVESLKLLPGMLPQGLNFSDYEYDEEGKRYLPKEQAEDGLYYAIGFRDGVISYVLILVTLDESNDAYYDEIKAISITEVGTVVIEIPEYQFS